MALADMIAMMPRGGLHGMAGSPTGMAKSTAHLLIADRATLTRIAATGRHQHAFWQLDHCDGGVIDADLPAGTLRLRRGQGVLLPPGAAHQFRYRPGSRYVSWKFTWSGAAVAQPVLLDAQPGWAGLGAALAAGPAEAAIPHLLAAAMHLAGAPDAPAGLAADIARLVDAHPARAWSVAAVGSALGLSPGHVSARFRTERRIALKRWLDTRRAELAARALAGSDLGIADIAERCGFADQFTFSRFFHRVTGESPSAFRARGLK
jgi:AraC-like DNA-binding protein